MKKILISLAVILGLGGWLLLYPPDPVFNALLEAERARHGLEHKVVTVDEIEWHYLEGGGGNDETIVMVHGFGADKDNWMRFGKFFVDDYRVIAPDLPGWGESTRTPDGDYRLPLQIERLEAFLKQLGIERFHLVGNSMGGHITALYGHKHPEQTLTLGLFNAAGVTEPTLSERTKAMMEGRNMLVLDSPDDFDSFMEFVFVEPPFVPPPAKRRIAERSAARRDQNDQILRQLMADPSTPLEPKLPEIQTPALVLWGDTDRLLDVSMTKVYRDLLPNERVVIMERMGHAPMIERPEETANIYREFLDQKPQ